MTHMLYIVVLWIGLGILSILWVRALLRGRDLEQQLYESGQPVDGLASPVRPEDIERYKRSQYFARIGGLQWPRHRRSGADVYRQEAQANAAYGRHSGEDWW